MYDFFIFTSIQGEFFFFNLINDKLEKFEQYMRTSRNWLARKAVQYSFNITLFSFGMLKLYLKTDYLKEIKEFLKRIDTDVTKEIEARKHIMTAAKEPVELKKGDSAAPISGVKNIKTSSVNKTITELRTAKTASKTYSNNKQEERGGTPTKRTSKISKTFIDSNNDANNFMDESFQD